ncbi:hypothetical protein [uncultured Nostoc sp.]|uniref:hypothetical protein n=1 Tax=uncultured Nostoc sp. TaxID=340711 RepID=UPI0035CB3B42
MVSKPFSYRLPDVAVQALEALQLEGETLNQTAQRVMMEHLGLSTETSQSLSTIPYTHVDIRELVKEEVRSQDIKELIKGEVRSQDIKELIKGEVRSQLEELRGKSKAR